MSILYQPMSRYSSLRRDSGCLTPNNQMEMDSKKSNEIDLFSIKGNSSGGAILSPPLSPYQRNCANIEPISHVSKVLNTCTEDKENKAETNQTEKDVPPSKTQEMNNCSLIISAWDGLDNDYKDKQIKFLEQYNIISAKENVSQSNRGRSERKTVSSLRKRFGTSDSDSDINQNQERVRTRRVVKESSVGLGQSDLESTRSSSYSPTPKRKRVRREYTGSPLALQQAAFIDESIPDYSPDVSSLPTNNNRILKVEWKGQPMDLRDDPNADKLHPAELFLASTLRLPCNVYLDSKRRLFFEKVTRLKNGMQFRRTDAQKACRIDVNKASRLFAAFEKVGWLDDKNFAKYL